MRLWLTLMGKLAVATGTLFAALGLIDLLMPFRFMPLPSWPPDEVGRWLQYFLNCAEAILVGGGLLFLGGRRARQG